MTSDSRTDGFWYCLWTAQPQALGTHRPGPESLAHSRLAVRNGTGYLHHLLCKIGTRSAGCCREMESHAWSPGQRINSPCRAATVRQSICTWGHMVTKSKLTTYIKGQGGTHASQCEQQLVLGRKIGLESEGKWRGPIMGYSTWFCTGWILSN